MAVAATIDEIERRFNRPRRYYLHKRFESKRDDQSELEVVWQAKQEAEPGVLLAATFPFQAKLATIGYTTVEDLDGADQFELVCAGLRPSEARAVLTALLVLLTP